MKPKESDESSIPGDDEFVIVPPKLKLGVNVYATVTGAIHVRNVGGQDPFDDEMKFILIDPDDAEAVAKAIIDTAREIKAG